MALTNITNFGLPRDLILNNEYNYIIGFDLGDGEVTASYLRLSDTRVDVKDINLSQVGDGTRLLSGIYIYNDSNIPPVIGSLVQLSKYTEDKGHLYVNFKVNPQRLNDDEPFEGSTRTKKEIIKCFAHEVLKGIKHLNPDYDFTGRGILALGCPSSPEWLENKRDLAYASIIKDAAKGSGLDLTVVVIPESRASLLKVYKENYTSEIRERMLKGVIVLDGGSSTFDVTYIDFNTNTQIDESRPLGASMIEKTILRKGLLDKGHTMGEMIRDLQARLDARSAKEAYFTDPALSPRLLLELKNEDLIKVTCSNEFMDSVINIEQVKYSTEVDSSVKGPWSGLHRKFLEDFYSRNLTGKPCFDGIVMLTGGASQMGFMQTNTMEVFPSAKILLDTKASYCVSRGLSYAMYADFMSYKLIEEAKKRIIAEITGNLSPLKELIADKLADIVYEFVSEETRKWAASDTDTTLDQFQKDVKSKFTQDTTTTDRQRHAKVKEAVRTSILEFLNAEGPNSVRTKIVNVVNTLFAQHFPGEINERHIPKFVFDKDQWSKVVDEITNMKEGTLGDLTMGIDIESGFVTMFKVAASVVLIFPVLAVSIIDAILATNMANWLTNLLDRALTKTYHKSDRKEAYEKYLNDKEKILGGIKQNLSISVLTPEAEKQFGERTTEVLSPVIDKAVDNVSLYF